MKRYGPIIAIVVVVVLAVGAVIIFGGSDDKKTVSPGTTTATTTAPTTATTVAATTSPSSAPTDSATTTPSSGSSVDTTGSTPETTPVTTPVTEPKPITFPLSFSQAKDQGVSVEWGPTCDQKTGRIAVPDFFTAECYAPFTGDNGGATADGVTADTITIAVYQGMADDPIISYITDAIKVDDTNAQQAETMTNMVNYFETYYETYGRKVKLQFVEGTGNASDETAARADAVHIAEDIKPFMVWGGPALTNAFADELSAHGVQCLACTPGQPPDWYVQRDPNVFGIASGAEQAQVHVLEMIKKQLIGKNAVHAGDEFVNSPRKFGYLWIESSSTSKDLADKFSADMSAAGAPLAESVSYQLDPASIQQSASQAIAKFKAAGVTSIIFSGDPVAPRDFTKEATAQGYFPEWVIGVSSLVDLNAFARTYDQDQWKHAFGYSGLAAKLTPEVSGYYALYKWFTGVEPPAKDTIGVFAPYPAVFFAALQGVGPNLTHDTWKNALFNGPPTPSAISQPSLSWGSHNIWPDPDYVGIDDGTEIWWDPSASGPDEIRKQGQGMYEFVDGGKRYLPGAWPTDDKTFDPTGAVTIYTTPPPGESAPSYPSPAG
ncbi:MAG: hypothetical protein JWN39_3716 [Ilumatobacteraceae bacterium]|nr:hypothetical protein [Ilumatobacteraceae bacterium]